MKTTMNLGKTIGVALAAFALLGAAEGCAGSTAATASPRLTVQNERASIHVEGSGSVEGGQIACGTGNAGTCAGEFEELWATHLVAKPAPGWKFSGWKRDAQPALSPSFGEEAPVSYTAVFERDAGAVATAR